MSYRKYLMPSDISPSEAFKATEVPNTPSAQPKIIQCKDCKEYDPIYTDGTGVCGHWNAKTKNNAYCSYAERRKG